MNAVHSSIDSHCLQTTNNDLFMTLEEKEALLTYVLQETTRTLSGQAAHIGIRQRPPQKQTGIYGIL